MKKQGLWAIVSVLVVLGLILASCAKAPAPTTPAPAAPTTPTAPVAPVKKIVWRTQASTPGAPNPRFPYRAAGTADYFLIMMKEAFPGRFDYTVAPEGSLVPEVDRPRGTGQGIIDFGAGYGPFYTGYIPEGNVEAGLPFSWEEPAHLYDAYYNLGLLPLLEEVYAELNVFPIPFSIGSLQGLGGWRGIADSPAFFKGKKVRSTGIWQKLVQGLGGSPVLVPRADSYMAMKLGTADAMIFSISALEDMKLKEVVDSWVVYPNSLDMAITMQFNRDSLAALPDDMRNFVKNEAKHIMAWYALATAYTEMRWVANKAERDGYTKLIRWSEADANYVRGLGYALWDAESAKSPRTAKMVEIVKKQMREYGKIK